MGKKAPKKLPKQLGRVHNPDAAEEEAAQEDAEKVANSRLPLAVPAPVDMCRSSFQMVSQAASANRSQPLLVLNYAALPSGWVDIFDVSSTPDGAYWPLAEVGPPGHSDLLQPGQLRTMQQRLRAARALVTEDANSAGLNLIKAILLTYDIQAPSPAGHFLQVVTLEACCREMLCHFKGPTPGGEPSSGGEGRSSIGSLTPEWALWVYGHHARSKLLLRPAFQVDGDVLGVDVDMTNLTTRVVTMGNVWGGQDHIMPYMLALVAESRKWERVLQFLHEFLNLQLPKGAVMPITSCRNMAVSYTCLLAAYHVHGPSSPITTEALERARAADPHRWVPLMMAGLALPPPAAGVSMVLTSRREAWAYVRRFGHVWIASMEPTTPGAWLDLTDKFATFSPELIWLMGAMGLPSIPKAVQRKLRGPRLVAWGYPISGVMSVISEVMEGFETFAASSSNTRMEAMEQYGGPAFLRNVCTFLLGLAHLTINQPTIDSSPDIWLAVAQRIGWAGCVQSKDRLQSCVKDFIPLATQLHRSYARLGLAGSLDLQQLPWPQELGLLGETVDALQWVACRWLWQAGEVRKAKQVALDQMEQHKQRLQVWELRADSSRGGSKWEGSPAAKAADGVWPASLEACQEVVDFLSAETVAGIKSARARGSSSGSSSSRFIPANPFKPWLDWLLSRRLCKEVALTMQVGLEGVDDVDVTELALVEKAGGRKVPFTWNVMAIEQLAAKAAADGWEDSGQIAADLGAVSTAMSVELTEALARTHVTSVEDCWDKVKEWMQGQLPAAAATALTGVAPPAPAAKGTAPARAAGKAAAAGQMVPEAPDIASGGSGASRQRLAAKDTSSSSSSRAGKGAAPLGVPGGGKSNVDCVDLEEGLSLLGMAADTRPFMALLTKLLQGKGVQSELGPGAVAKEAEAQGATAGGEAKDGLFKVQKLRYVAGTASLPQVPLTAGKGGRSGGTSSSSTSTGKAAKAPAQQQQQQGPSAGLVSSKSSTGASAAASGSSGSRGPSKGQQPPADAAAAASKPARAGGTAAGSPASLTGAAAPAGHTEAGSSSRDHSSGVSKEPTVGRSCSWCGQVFTLLQRCAGCKAVAYCGRGCQADHWRAGHRHECAALAAAAAGK